MAQAIAFQFDDGGRQAAGFKGTTGDCVCRAIAIATEQPYQTVYDALTGLCKQERITKRHQKRSTVRSGIAKPTSEKYLTSLGWTWVPTMTIGSGCRVHLRANELPAGRLIVSVTRHVTTVIDGVLHDTYDCSRDGMRCVYGYFTKGVE
jgi:hypothetical protein